MSAVLQIVGALSVLAAFVGVQLDALRPSSCPSLVLNLGGSALLAVLALLDGQWGFLLLEACWAAVSAYGLAGRIITRESFAR